MPEVPSLPGSLFGNQHAPDEPICSAKGCGADAVWAIRWNNPRLHTPERRKVWLSCDGHVDELRDFLALRGFVKDVVAIADLQPGDG